jgi:ATP-binding cassette, subfamily B (MDR/TAP), member 1
MRLAFLKSLLNQPISILDLVPPGQTAAIITNTANTMQLGISEKLATFIQGISLVVSAMAIAFAHNWKLTLVTSSGLVIIAACYGFTIPLVVGKMKQVEESEIGAGAVAAEAFGSVRMIAACGAESKMAKRYTYWANESKIRGLGMSKIIAIQQAVGKFISRVLGRA